MATAAVTARNAARISHLPRSRAVLNSWRGASGGDSVRPCPLFGSCGMFIGTPLLILFFLLPGLAYLVFEVFCERAATSRERQQPSPWAVRLGSRPLHLLPLPRRRSSCRRSQCSGCRERPLPQQ